MNFFDAQDKARRLTRWLVIVYGVATLLIVAGATLVVTAAFYGFGQNGRPPPVELLAGVAGITLLVILGATLYRMARLASGGGRVAAELGGTRLDPDGSDPLKRRLQNVVEEMAIASGVPVPEIYVLEQERSINAFAAGFTPDDAAVAVTRGTLELLNRDELQGVIAHEFSHILNGDMRLNIRMMGVLFGIMVIGLIGRTIMRGTRGSIRVSRRGRSGGGIVLVGLGLSILGWIGVFFARIIKAAVSRQREYLADASAVQFTRQADGIANALKKIGGYQAHSYLQSTDAEEISHMLFALGAKLTGLFATHPPLTARIRAIDPQFDDSQYPSVEQAATGVAEEPEPRAAGFAGATASVAADDVVASVGQPGPEHVAYASALHRSIPDELLAPVHSIDQAYLVVLALLLDPDRANARRQLELLAQQLGAGRASLVSRYHADLIELGASYRLPLLELAFPALRQSTDGQKEFLLDLARRLVEHDGVVDLREFCLYQVLSHSLKQAAAPSQRPAGRRPPKDAVRRAAMSLLHVLADLGHDSDREKRLAFDAGRARFGRWSESQTYEPVTGRGVRQFRDALNILQRTGFKAKRTLVEAATSTIVMDGHVNTTEAEMLRTVCAALDCPMPPIPPTGDP